MKKSNSVRIVFTICILVVLIQSIVTASNPSVKLKRGEDLVIVPAMGEGLCLHNLFQSDMVIQRDKPIGIWGWATPGEKVKVMFNNNERSAIAGQDRSWKVSFPEMAASSDPIKIIVEGKSKTITLGNILVGDVWVLGGQSNMEHPIARVEDGDLEIASANFDNIRILTVPQPNGHKTRKDFNRLYEWHSFFNTHYRKGEWDICTPENVKELSAIGYVFARRIHMASRVPIGVVDISRGGTCVETWLPLDLLKTVDTPEVKAKLAEWDKKIADYDPQKDLQNRIDRYNQWVERMKKDGKEIPADRKVPSDLKPGPAVDMNRPGNCYASIFAPIAGLQVKGALWHQGFNNAMQINGHVMYYQLFAKMIEIWREGFSDPKLPFGIISLCTVGAPQTLDNYLEKMIDEGIYIREVQYKTFLDLYNAGDKNIGFASSYDMRRSWYHPGLKVPVGERIARWALATQYGQKIDWKPPVITDIKIADGKIILTTDIPLDPQKDSPMQGFAIAGKDRRFQPATADHLVTKTDKHNRKVYDYNKIVLSSPYVKEPVNYRYAWGRNPMGNLRPRYNYSASPLATQRSDNWKMYQVPVKFSDKPDKNAINQARMANRIFDMERRIKDAKRVIDENQKKNSKELASWEAKWEKAEKK